MIQLPHASLEEIAEEAGFAVSDLFDEDRWDWFQSLTPMQQVQWRYCHADCDDFAHTLSAVTQWPVVCFESKSTGPIHRAVQAPDGRFLDAEGWATLETLRKRYRTRGMRLAPDNRAFCPLVEDEDDLSAVLDAIAVLDIEPFNSPAFKCLVGSFRRRQARF